MTIIVGLGNPGQKYKNTRPNLGFMVLDELAKRWQKAFSRDHTLFENLQKSGPSYSVQLIKPMTFMNRSGNALAHLISNPDFEPDRLMVVLDDLALPLGKIRVRPKGTDGGHNGLFSIIDTLGHTDFPRLRLGIGLDLITSTPVVDYVLSSFSRDEKPIVKDMVKRAADAITDFLENDIHHTMNRYNS